MEYFFLALAGLLFGLAKAVWLALAGVVAWLVRFFWPFWLVAVLVLALGGSCRTCEAGWLDWIWGDSQADIKKIERSAELAQEAARVTSEAARSQAQQAVAQAEQAAAQAHQNSRVADLLGELSQERQHLADQITALNTLGLKDSQVAAVLGASGPVLVCVTALMVAGLALWLTTRQGAGPSTDLATAVDVMAEELAVVVNTAAGTGLRLGGPGPRSSSGLLGLAMSPLGPDGGQVEPSPGETQLAVDADPADEAPMPF
jgi:ABC-type multidrug transport system fused ATPase/permease subunit